MSAWLSDVSALYLNPANHPHSKIWNYDRNTLGSFFFTKHNQNKEENSCIQMYRAKVCPWVCLVVCLYLKCVRACEDMFLQRPGDGNKQGQTDVTTISIEWKRFKGQPCPHDPTPDTGQQRASGGAPTSIGGNGSTPTNTKTQDPQPWGLRLSTPSPEDPVMARLKGFHTPTTQHRDPAQAAMQGQAALNPTQRSAAGTHQERNTWLFKKTRI